MSSTTTYKLIRMGVLAALITGGAGDHRSGRCNDREVNGLWNNRGSGHSHKQGEIHPRPRLGDRP